MRATTGRPGFPLPGTGGDIAPRRVACALAVALTLVLCVCSVVGFAGGPGLITALHLAAVSYRLTAEDICSHRLPNRIVLPGYVTLLGDLVWCWVATGVFPFGAGLVLGGVLAVFLSMSVAGGLGMGDVKLSGVLAGCLALLSVELALLGLVIGFLVGGFTAGVMLAVHPDRARHRMPFGPFLLAGFWFAVVLRIVHPIG